MITPSNVGKQATVFQKQGDNIVPVITGTITKETNSMLKIEHKSSEKNAYVHEFFPKKAAMLHCVIN